MPKSDVMSIYKERRQQFLRQLHEGFALLFNAPIKLKSGDTEFEYCPDKYFYYLTGCTEFDAAAIFQPKSGKPQNAFTMFVREMDPKKAVWIGKNLGPEGAVKELQADKAYPFPSWREHASECLRNHKRFHYGWGLHRTYDDQVHNIVTSYRPDMRAGDRPLTAIQNPMMILNEMRLIKDAHEIALMEKAASISAKAYESILHKVGECQHEYEAEALIEYEFRRHGARGTSFNSIVAGGNNATVLHYEHNNDPIKKGDLLLLDTGCDFDYYASDVTRTIPISGKFSKEQRTIYEIVLEAQKEVIRKARAGVRYEELQTTAKENLAKGLLQHKILKGTQAQALASEEFARYYPHKIGHWLGLDVHDVGDYFEEGGTTRMLKPGMVLTIEPGLYFPKEDKSVPPGYRGIGVRIEDNVLITKTGNRVLTEAIPKEVAELEAIMKT